MLRTVEIMERINIRCANDGLKMRDIAVKLEVSSSFLSDLIYRRRSVSREMSSRILSEFSWRGRTWSDIFEQQTYTNTAGRAG